MDLSHIVAFIGLGFAALNGLCLTRPAVAQPLSSSAPAAGSVVGWGSTSSGKLNIPDSLSNIVSVACGDTFGLALRVDGTVVGWGNTNGSGIRIPMPSGLTNILAVSAALGNCLAVRTDGTVVSWGGNIADPSLRRIPAALTNAVAIAAGSSHNLAVTTAGTVLGWGDNLYGQTNVPAGLSNVVSVAAGALQSLAVRTDGTVVMWGKDDVRRRPFQVPAAVGHAVAISAKEDQCLVLRADGTLYGWNVYDQDRTNSAPVLSKPVVAIAAGVQHNLALLVDGTIVAWGTAAPLTLSLPPGLSNVITVAAGADSSLAVLAPNHAPVIWRQPITLSVRTGHEIRLGVGAFGPGDFAYQWQFNGTNLAGATQPELRLPNALAQSSGAYQVLVSNLNGSTLSAPISALVTPNFVERLDVTVVGPLTNAQVHLTGAAEVGREYWVQFSDRLAKNQPWMTLTNVSTATGSLDLLDPFRLQTAAGFYRLISLEDPLTSPALIPLPDMLWLPPGKFIMSSPPDELDRASWEGPQTEVTLTRGFFIGRYEVTQRLWRELFASNPSAYQTALDLPVDSVLWERAQQFCTLLTDRERQAGRLPPGWLYRLPTEAEWEYAARAGTQTRFSFGDDLEYTQLPDYGWFSVDSGQQTHAVGSKRPNPRGLFDTYGNVAEWCLDYYVTPGGSVTDPRGPSPGGTLVSRGGSYAFGGVSCRSASRSFMRPGTTDKSRGFRMVLVQE